jgi:hypothetical protein
MQQSEAYNFSVLQSNRMRLNPSDLASLFPRNSIRELVTACRWGRISYSSNSYATHDLPHTLTAFRLSHPSKISFIPKSVNSRHQPKSSDRRFLHSRPSEARA